MSKIPAQILLVDENNVEHWVVNINSLTVDELLNDGISKDQMMFTENINEELTWISDMLEWSSDSGLSGEVVQFALLAMKRNPELSPAQAMAIGYGEWVK
jgi:hypothetical protein